MPREARITKPTHLTPFAALVWDALSHYHNPLELGQTSPLAEAYFLGQDLLQTSIDELSPRLRGEVLIKLIQRADHSLIQGKVDTRLLQACFIAPQIEPDEDQLKPKAISLRKRLKDVKISHATFYKTLVNTELPQQVEQLAQAILQQRRVALRLEQPPTPPPLYERDQIVDSCRDILVNRFGAIGLTGASGTGKTALGQYLAHTYFQKNQVFWFTFRLHFNDHLLELLFNLGHFCQLCLQQLNRPQNSALLTTLISAMQTPYQTALPQETWLNAWRIDLTSMPRPPLLCFDEVDLLHYETPSHEPLLQFLQSLLTEPIPLIFMGQELPFLVLPSYPLTTLTLADGLAKFLAYRQLTLSADEQKQLHTLTQGNPRGLELWATFYQLGGRLSDFPTQLPYYALLERISKCLTEADHALLHELVVFRQAISISYWAKEIERLTRLKKLQLIEFELGGEVQVRAHWRDYLTQELKHDPPLWQACQAKAAEICTQQGQFTAALFHYIQSKNYHDALICWQEHRQRELEQGQAEQALHLLETIPETQLTHPHDVLLLTELLVELYKLRGQYTLALAIMARLPQRDKNLSEAHLRRLEGDILELRSQNTRARQAYQAGLDTIEHLLIEKALFHKNLAWIHRLAKGEDKSWGLKAETEIKQAQFEINYVWGVIKRNRGQPHEALALFQKALTVAQELNYLEGMAKAQNGLGLILMDSPESWQEAATYFQQALMFYEKMGRLTYIAAIHGNLALLYGNLLTPRPEAIFHGQTSLAAYQKIGEPLGMAKAAQNLAETYLKLKQLTEAEQYATLVLQQEIPEVIPDALRTLGEIALIQQHFQEAEDYFKSSLQLCLDNDDPYLAGYAYCALMQLYHATHRHGFSQQAYQQAIMAFSSYPLEATRTHQLWQQLQTPD